MTGPAIPPHALALHSAILGMTGSGKTTTTKLAVEQIVPTGAKVCILDPIKSDWWGLTSSADGNKPGLPFYILGGPHGHLPLEADAGAIVGELIATGRLPLSIIDMAKFKAGGHAKFFIALAETLLERMEGVLYLVIEEAHLFAPKERAGIGSENLAVHYAKMLATAGRSKGIRLIVATQRVQALHNAILGSCGTLIAHRIGYPADQAPVLKWMKANIRKSEWGDGFDEDTLAALPTGVGILCGGGTFREMRFPRITTFDNTATPEVGSRRLNIPVTQAPVDVKALRAALAPPIATITADPKAKPETKKALQEAAAAGASLLAEVEAAERRGYARGREEGMRIGVKAISAITTEMIIAANRVREESDRLLLMGEAMGDPFDGLLEGPDAKPVGPEPIAELDKKLESVVTALKDSPKPKGGPSGANGTLNSAARKLLGVLDTNPPVRRSWTQAATLAGLKARGGHFNAGRKALVDGGYIVEEGGLVWIAKPSAGAPAGDTNPKALIEMWSGSLSGAAPKILRDLFAQGGRSSRAIVAERLGMQPRGGHWNAAWKELRDNGIVRMDGDKTSLTELFMPQTSGQR